MKYLLIVTFLTSSLTCLAQTPLQQSSGQSEAENLNSKSYVIGIGNKEKSVFNAALNYLENDINIEVSAVCNGHRIIQFSIVENNYKGYDEVRDNLLNAIDELLLYRKHNDAIFIKDCSDEYIKQ